MPAGTTAPTPPSPYKRARALVRRAHPLYTELVGAMGHDANEYNKRIHTITKHRLNTLPLRLRI